MTEHMANHSPHDQKAKENERRRPGSHTPLQGHTPNDLKTSHSTPSGKISTTSQECHSGEHSFNSWAFGRWYGGACNPSTQETVAGGSQILGQPGQHSKTLSQKKVKEKYTILISFKEPGITIKNRKMVLITQIKKRNALKTFGKILYHKSTEFLVL
jgi:hypothetical protein